MKFSKRTRGLFFNKRTDTIFIDFLASNLLQSDNRNTGNRIPEDSTFSTGS